MDVTASQIEEIVRQVVQSMGNGAGSAANTADLPKVAHCAMLVAPKKFEVKEIPIPELTDDDILVRVEGAGVCGTDVHEWRQDPFGLIPVVLGHEGTGEVVYLGKNIKCDTAGKPLKVGDKLVTSVISCGDCYVCRMVPGRTNLCDNQGVFGLIGDKRGTAEGNRVNGWFADYMLIRGAGATYFQVNDLNLNQRMLLELAAVCDIAESKRLWADENLPGVPCYEDYKEMIDSGVCDTVIVATPHYFHSPIAIYAFEKGKNVLTEKPAGVYTKQVEEMNAAAKKSGKVFGIMYNQRTNPKFQKMREIVQSGELGELKRCIWIITNWYRTQAYYDSGTWRATWAGEGGGVLLNQCPHQLDLWQWIFGMPNRVMGHCKYGHWHNIEVEDEVTAYAEYPNGATGAFITTTGECPGTNRLEITGDKGKLVWEEGKLTWWKLAVPEREFCVTCKEGFAQPEMTVTEVETDNIELGHNGILQNFTNAILYGEELLAPGYEGINGLNISNAIHLSDWTGKPQAVPVDGELFLKYLNERRATSHVKEEKEDSGKIADLSGTYNDRWKVR